MFRKFVPKLVPFVRKHKPLLRGGRLATENFVAVRISAEFIDDFLVVKREPCRFLVFERPKETHGFFLDFLRFGMHVWKIEKVLENTTRKKDTC